MEIFWGHLTDSIVVIARFDHYVKLASVHLLYPGQHIHGVIKLRHQLKSLETLNGNGEQNLQETEFFLTKILL